MFPSNIIKYSFFVPLGAVVGGVVYLILPYVWIAAAIIIITRRSVSSIALVFQRLVAFQWRPFQSYEAERKSKKSEAVGNIAAR